MAVASTAREIDRLRAHRVNLRKKIRVLSGPMPPISDELERRRIVEMLQLELRSTQAEWDRLNEQAALKRRLRELTHNRHSSVAVRRRSVPNTVRAWSELTVKTIAGDERVITGTASTPQTDLVGDRIDPAGAQFNLPMPLLHHHDHRAPIGSVFSAQVRPDGIHIAATIAKVDAPATLKDRLDTAWAEIKAGLARGLSIGFKPLEWEFLDDGKDAGIHYKSYRWLELSVVVVPANLDAGISTIRAADLRHAA